MRKSGRPRLVKRYGAEEPKGECVLVIEGKSFDEKDEEKKQAWEKMSIEEHVAFYENAGVERKEAMRMAAKDRGIRKRDVYQRLMKGSSLRDD